MTTTHPTLAAYLEAPAMLLVMRSREAVAPELFLAMGGDGSVTAFNGHVDLGTGIRTALAQIVAEELDVPFESVAMVLGSTSAVPDQGATIASETIQVTAVPLRAAAATARAYLLGLAAERLGEDRDNLATRDGAVLRRSDGQVLTAYAGLIGNASVRIELDPAVAVKQTADYRLVGRSQARSDIPGKVTGAWTYVHDVRVPGMLHGRVVRPPHAGFDIGTHVGASLLSVDESSVADIAGLVGVVVIGDFVGVVAVREEDADRAMRRLKVTWREPPPIPDLGHPEAALRANPSMPRKLADMGDVTRALEGSAQQLDRVYVWPYQMHGSIGPSCAVADWHDDGLTVWSGTQNPFPMRRDLALLMDMPEKLIVVERLEAAGCYGRNCADDVTADAALLSRAVGRPVRVQLTRDQEHGWEPKGAAQVIDVRGGLDLEGGPSAYDFETRYPSNLAPTLPLILTGKLPPVADVVQMGDRTAIPPYAYDNMRVTVHDMPPIARASWFRGVSAMPNTFAHESFIDELATAAGVDPVEYRLRYLKEPRAVELVRAVAERAAWKPHTGPGTHGRDGDILYGRGFAYAVYVHGKFPGTAAAWSAWVADVAVNRVTGEVAVTRVICGQDTGQMINPDGVRHQIHGNVIQSTSRVLKEEVGFSRTGVTSREWGGYPIITFPEVPEIDVLLMPRQDEPPLGAGESASVPSAAAIANALFDATGVRFRELPLTPEKVRKALNPETPPPSPPPARRKWRWPFAGLLAGSVVTAAALIPWRPAIPPIREPVSGVYTDTVLERGRLAAAVGACNVCHTGNDGALFAGGRALDTPFGTVFASNITPDPEAGIGAWSYTAFSRAMRDGVSRDGHFLYPAHPYTSFAKADEQDIQALYAYLMSQAPSSAKAPETRLRFPFNMRFLMAGWNFLFLSPKYEIDLAAPALVRRGAELVEGLGHCSACHSDRNLMGAEKAGSRHLAGGFADGWQAPSLRGVSAAPVAWSEAQLFDYLRHGHAADHGVAGGPMAQVVKALAPLPDEDIRAMAAYLAGIDPEPRAAADGSATRLAALEKADAGARAAALAAPVGARIFEGSCASCHGPQGDFPSLALNTNLHLDRPDNLIQSVLHGVTLPDGRNGNPVSMPAFAQSFDRPQMIELLRFLRLRFAPGNAEWQDLDAALHRVATASAHH